MGPSVLAGRGARWAMDAGARPGGRAGALRGPAWEPKPARISPVWDAVHDYRAREPTAARFSGGLGSGAGPETGAPGLVRFRRSVDPPGSPSELAEGRAPGPPPLHCCCLPERPGPVHHVTRTPDAGRRTRPGRWESASVWPGGLDGTFRQTAAMRVGIRLVHAGRGAGRRGTPGDVHGVSNRAGSVQFVTWCMHIVHQRPNFGERAQFVAPCRSGNRCIIGGWALGTLMPPAGRPRARRRGPRSRPSTSSLLLFA